MHKKIAVIGFKGKLGRVACEAIEAHAGLQLAVQIGRGDDTTKLLQQQPMDVVLDVSIHTMAYQHACLSLDLGIHHVIGSSGISSEHTAALDKKARKAGLSCLWAPNFSMAACLMMRFAQIASPYFEHIDIIEAHHSEKKDKPSGTALHTKARIEDQTSRAIPVIHSIRSSGFLATQQVICATADETLEIKQSTNHRRAFAQGVCFALEKAGSFTGMRVGLDAFLTCDI